MLSDSKGIQEFQQVKNTLAILCEEIEGWKKKAQTDNMPPILSIWA